MNTIQAEWENFRKMVIPKNASDIQVAEMKKAFYGGATTVMATMLRISCEDVSEEAGAEILETLKAECEKFARNGGV